MIATSNGYGRKMYLLFFVLAIIGLFFHRSKYVSYILGVYIFVVAAFNIDNPDYHSYILIYNDPMGAQEEIGFRLLCLLGNTLGLSYNAFHFVIVLLGFILLIKGISIIRKHESVGFDNIVEVSYMFYPMMNDIILIRFFLVACIIIYALHFLLDGERIKFLLSIMMASTIHISALFFLILLLGYSREKANGVFEENVGLFLSKRFLTKQMIAVLTVLITAAFVLLLKMSIPQEILRMAGYSSKKIDIMLAGTSITFRKVLFYILLYFSNFAVFIIIRRRGMRTHVIQKHAKIDMLAYVLNCAMLINIVFTIYSDQFLRLLGLTLMINSLYYMVILGEERCWRNRALIVVLGMLPAVFMFVLRMFIYVTPSGVIYFDYAFKTIINNNQLLMFIKSFVD